MNRLETPMCRDCERLWQAYQRATTESLALLSRLRRGSDQEPAESLIREINTAEFNKKTAKEALDAHMAETGHR